MSEHNIQENMHILTDLELVKLSCENNSAAFAELARRYLALVRKRVLSFHRSGLETDDLSQEGLLGLLDATRSYNADSSVPFHAYADVCIKNRLISALRNAETDKNRIHINSISLTDDLKLQAGILSQPEEQMIEREEERLLQQFICRHLSDVERNVLYLYLSGYSYKEISDKLSVTKKTCDNAMQRVRKKLKNSFKDMPR